MFLDIEKKILIDVVDDKNNRESWHEAGENARIPVVACCHISWP